MATKEWCLLYLGSGDLSIHMMDNCVSSTMSFPVKLYRGVGVVIDLDKVANYPPEILRDTAIHINEFKRKFCEDDHYLVMPTRDKIEHIFSQLYSLPDCMQRPYFKLKVQELMLFYGLLMCTKKNKGSNIYLRKLRLSKEFTNNLYPILEKEQQLKNYPKNI